MQRIRSRVEAALAGRSIAEVAIVFPLWVGASWFAWLLIGAPLLKFLPRAGPALFIASLVLWCAINLWLFAVIIAYGRKHRMSRASGPIHLLQISFIVLIVPRILAFGSDGDREILPQILLGLECLILAFMAFYLFLGSLMKNPPPRREWLTAVGMLVIVAFSFAHRAAP